MASSSMAARAVGSEWWECHALTGLAEMHRLEGEFARAEQMAEEGEAEADEDGGEQDEEDAGEAFLAWLFPEFQRDSFSAAANC